MVETAKNNHIFGNTQLTSRNICGSGSSTYLSQIAQFHNSCAASIIRNHKVVCAKRKTGLTSPTDKSLIFGCGVATYCKSHPTNKKRTKKIVNVESVFLVFCLCFPKKMRKKG